MRPIPLAIILVLAAAPAAAQSAPAPAPRALSDSAARTAIGEVVSVSGLVVQAKAHSRMGSAYLNFGGHFPDHTFSVIIPDSALVKFGDLARFEGHRARATGLVWLQDGKWPAMTLTDPAALELLP